MFETLFSRSTAIQRHRVGPLAGERAAYLETLADQATPRATMRIRAHYCLRIARELDNWPRDHHFTPAEIDAMAAAWAAQSIARGRASTAKNPRLMFRIAAVAFLRSIGRLRLEPISTPGRYEGHIEAFIEEQRQNRWQSEATCRSGRWKVETFLSYLEDQGCDLASIDVRHVDAYFQHITHSLSTYSRKYGNVFVLPKLGSSARIPFEGDSSICQDQARIPSTCPRRRDKSWRRAPVNIHCHIFLCSEPR